MNRFKLIIENNFKKYSNTVDSVFYIEVDDNYFPCKGWTDYIYPVLYDWTNEILKYFNADNVRFNLYFMDGPYYLLCEKKYSDVIVQCFYRDKLQLSCTMEYTVLIQELKNAIGKFFRYSRHIEIDEKMFKKFRALLAQIKNIVLMEIKDN